MKRILVVDDEKPLRFLISETLELKNYHLYQANDGEEGLNLFIEKRPDLLILDLMMPKLNGYEVIEEIKKQKLLNQSKIIILTAREEQVEKKILKNSVDYFLTKPFSPLELLNIVEKIFNTD